MTVEHYTVIIVYLASKLECGERWYITPDARFSDRTPQQLVLDGEGDIVVRFLETRLGIRKGVAF